MTAYQLDQCLNSKRFADSCARQGLAEINRFPRRLLHRKDPDVLGVILPSNHALLTIDRRMHFEHAASIPDQHSGILIIARSVQRTLGISDVARILTKFKSAFPNWHAVSIRNSIVEITETSVQVWISQSRTIKSISFVTFDQDGWQEVLAGVLRENSQT
jgi:hypothetical protein